MLLDCIFECEGAVLYNQCRDAETGRTVWLATVLPRVLWRRGGAAALGAGGPVPEGGRFLRLPEADAPGGWLPPEDWAALGCAEAAGHWTLQKGDILVRGQGPAAIESAADVRGLHHAVVAGAWDNRRGAAVLRHWKIWAV